MPKRALIRKLPWNDRAGRFSPLKTAALVSVCLPILYLLYRTIFVGLGARPLTEAIHVLGDWTIYFLLITLAVTPARRLFNLPKLIQVRRILGLSALAYILAHFALYIADSKFDLLFVTREITLRIYLTIGFVAILGLIVLGATSTDGIIRRLGALRWNRLHRLVYLIAPLAIIHYYLQSKVDVSLPVVMSGFFFWLMGYRLMRRYRVKDGLLSLFVLSIAATCLTVIAEALWYGLMTGVGASPVLWANISLEFGIRPMWWVLAAGIGVSFAADLRRRFAPLPLSPRQAEAG